MKKSLAHIALIVRDYDEAIAFFVGKLGFRLLEDRPEKDKRWVLVAPTGSTDEASSILLARASSPEQEALIGNQAGGGFSCFFEQMISGVITGP